MSYVASQINIDRSGWAETALRAFENETMAAANEDDATILGDLLADLMHYCAQKDISWNEVLQSGVSHFEAERDGVE